MAKREKKIELVKMRVGDIKTGFGNPRKITSQKKKELATSMEMFGDFGIFLIDEDDNVIAGNQRLSILQEKDENIVVDCKKMIGYTKAELKAINIKDNTHAGEWDMDMLADWTADLNLDLGLDEKEQGLEKQKIEGMDPIRFEKYDYVMIVCDNEIDYNELCRNLGLEDAKVRIAKRKIKARAVWYHKMKGQIVSAEKAKEMQEAELAQMQEEYEQEEEA